jgi:hypothetical protein
MVGGPVTVAAFTANELAVQQNAVVDGNLDIGGDVIAANFTQTSSREIKDNIIDLSNQEALEVLEHLSPMKFNYKAEDDKKVYMGFIAEDVPESVASSDRIGVKPHGYCRHINAGG